MDVVPPCSGPGGGKTTVAGTVSACDCSVDADGGCGVLTAAALTLGCRDCSCAGPAGNSGTVCTGWLLLLRAPLVVLVLLLLQCLQVLPSTLSLVSATVAGASVLVTASGCTNVCPCAASCVCGCGTACADADGCACALSVNASAGCDGTAVVPWIDGL